MAARLRLPPSRLYVATVPGPGRLWGKPTLINNVETFANIAPIILNGGAWYAGYGTERNRGAKLFAGKINNTGLVEVPFGVTVRE